MLNRKPWLENVSVWPYTCVRHVICLLHEQIRADEVRGERGGRRKNKSNLFIYVASDVCNMLHKKIYERVHKRFHKRFQNRTNKARKRIRKRLIRELTTRDFRNDFARGFTK